MARNKTKARKSVGTHEISSGAKRRELIIISEGSKGKLESKTVHQKRTSVNGNWFNSFVPIAKEQKTKKLPIRQDAEKVSGNV